MKFVKENKTFRKCDLRKMSLSDDSAPPNFQPSSANDNSDSSFTFAPDHIDENVCKMADIAMPELDLINENLNLSVDAGSVETMDLVCRSRLEASSSEALQSTLRGNSIQCFYFYNKKK